MDRRAILATVVCMGIFLLWMLVLAPKFFPPQPAVPPAPATTPAPAPKDPPGPTVPPAAVPQVKPPEYALVDPIPFETKHLKIKFTNKGAGILSLILHYPDEKTEPIPLLLPDQAAYPHFALLHVNGPDSIESLHWKVEDRKAGEPVVFSYPLRNGITIRKTFKVEGDFLIKMTLELNPPKPEEGKPPVENILRLELKAFNGLFQENPYQYEKYFKGAALVGKGDPKYFDLAGVAKGWSKLTEAGLLPLGPERDKKAQDARELLGPPVSTPEAARRWMGLRNRFFAVLLLPDEEVEKKMKYYYFKTSSPNAVENTKSLKNLDVVLETMAIPVSDRPFVWGFTAYAGPIQSKALQGMSDASKLLDYGTGCLPGLSFLINLVGPLILGILKFFSGLLANWGLGIIATTLLIRICIFPLSKKSQESAYRMQQLAPKIKILRERYKDDQQKFGMEQMRLFREHKINPLSGCLPLLLQLPIFVGMFSVFDTSIELRSQPFLLWISDLSRPDRLFHWEKPFDVFFLPTIDALNLLPIVMTVTWFLQAYFAPRSPDPQMQQQQKIMLAMPIVFGLMCYNYASGLSLYFFVNSLLAMIEQKVIKKYILKIPAEGQGPAPGDAPVKV